MDVCIFVPEYICYALATNTNCLFAFLNIKKKKPLLSNSLTLQFNFVNQTRRNVFWSICLVRVKTNPPHSVVYESRVTSCVKPRLSAINEAPEENNRLSRIPLWDACRRDRREIRHVRCDYLNFRYLLARVTFGRETVGFSISPGQIFSRLCQLSPSAGGHKFGLLKAV